MKSYILLILFLLISGCALKEVIDIAAKSDNIKPPNWDMKFNVPLIEKKEDMNGYFSVPNIAKASITLPAFQMFRHLQKNTALNNLPVIPELLDAQDIKPTVISQPINIDLNEDGTSDVTISEIKSSTGYIEIIISCKKDGSPFALEPGDIALTGIIVENTKYLFKQPTRASVDGKLTFKTTTFLSNLTKPIRPDATGDVNEIDIEIGADLILFNTLGKPSLLDGKDLSNPLVLTAFLNAINDSGTFGEYAYSFDAVFSFGSDFEIEGVVLNETPLIEIKDQEVPLTESQNFINQFTIKLDTTNRLPIGLSLKNASFSNSNFNVPIIEVFDDDTTTDLIELPIGIKHTNLTTQGTIFDKGTLGLNLSLVIAENTILKISKDMYLHFIMSLSGSGQVDLQYF